MLQNGNHRSDQPAAQLRRANARVSAGAERKRLGWLATAVFLELNGITASRASNDDVYELVIWIASANPDLDDITTRLRPLVRPRRCATEE